MYKNLKVYAKYGNAAKALQKLPDVGSEAKKADSRRNYESAAESFERCDTDGCLSQWASNCTGRKNMAEAYLAEHGNCAVFPVLVDVDNNIVAMELHTWPNKFAPWTSTQSWRVMRLGSQKAEWVTDYKNESNFAKKGLKKAWVVAPAFVDSWGPFNHLDQPRGLSGAGMPISYRSYIDFRKLNEEQV